jgi:hypothetical protein
MQMAHDGMDSAIGTQPNEVQFGIVCFDILSCILEYRISLKFTTRHRLIDPDNLLVNNSVDIDILTPNFAIAHDSIR